MTKTVSLFHIFPNRPFVDVLNFFLFHPQEEALLARIVTTTGRALIQVQRAIKRLIASGLITKKKRGKKTYYLTNYTHPVVRDLKHVLLEEKLFSERVQKIFRPIRKKIHYAFIFGSTARGEETATSDIDFFIIGDLNTREIGTLFCLLSEEFLRECNGVVFSLKDFQARLKNPISFINEVIKSPKIWLLGEKNEFTKMGQGRKDLLS